MPQDKKQFIYPAILIVLVALTAIYNVYWLGADKTPIFADEVDHINFCQDYYFNLQQGKIVEYFLMPSAYYPPLLYYVSSFLCLFFGHGYYTLVFSQILFHLILVLSVYAVGKLLWDEKIGLLAGILSMTYPLMVLLTHRYFQDVSLAAMTALALYLLYKSEEFGNKKFTWLFFIASGFAMLAKINFVFFISLPFFWFFICFIKKKWAETDNRKFIVLSIVFLPIVLFLGYEIADLIDVEDKASSLEILGTYLFSLLPTGIYLIFISFSKIKDKQLKTFFQGASVCFMMVWHFYFFHFANVMDMAKGQKAVGNNTSGFIDFAQLFIQGYQGTGWFLFTIAGIVFYLITKDKNRDRNILLASCFFIIVIHYFFPFKENRYFMPLIAFSSPFMALWALRIKPVPLRWGALAVISGFVFFSLFGYNISNPGAGNPWYNIYWNHSHFQLSTLAPYPVDHWKLEEMTDETVKLLDGGNNLLLYISPTGMKENLPYRIYPVKIQIKEKQKLYFVKNLRDRQFNYPDSRINMYSFLLCPGGIYNKSSKFDNIIVLYIRTPETKDEIPPQFRQKLEEAGIRFNPDLVKEIKPDANIRVTIMRIPINPPVSKEEMEFSSRPLVRVMEIQKIWGKGSYF
ncbi:MAG: glycosyltransferase family 39 protein [Firmicutes bacterium]|nr:glycosyltransferase family 39 protein [Bacillota bacterium]